MNPSVLVEKIVEIFLEALTWSDEVPERSKSSLSVHFLINYNDGQGRLDNSSFWFQVDRRSYRFPAGISFPGYSTICQPRPSRLGDHVQNYPIGLTLPNFLSAYKHRCCHFAINWEEFRRLFGGNQAETTVIRVLKMNLDGGMMYHSAIDSKSVRLSFKRGRPGIQPRPLHSLVPGHHLMLRFTISYSFVQPRTYTPAPDPFLSIFVSSATISEFPGVTKVRRKARRAHSNKKLPDRIAA